MAVGCGRTTRERNPPHEFLTETTMRQLISRLAGAMLSLLFVCMPAFSSTAFAQLKKGEAKECQPLVEKILLNQALKATTTFPGSHLGINLDLDGKWNTKYNQNLIKNNGVGLAINDAATITQVKLKDDTLEIHLNGGGFGTFADLMATSDAEKALRKGASKVSGGSRINLKLNGAVSCDVLTNADKLIGYLAPLVDATSLKLVAARQQIAPEWEDAAAKKLILAGMDKLTVFAILGEPKQKNVDLTSEPPTEKWQYELPSLKTRVVTFQDGKVIKVDEF